MPATSRIDIRLTHADYLAITEAAQLSAVSVSAFCRNAALAKANDVFIEEQKIVLSRQDFIALNTAIACGFNPNIAMQKTLASGAGITYA